MPIDQRNVLDEEPFEYKVLKDNKNLAKITGNFKRGNEQHSKI